MENYKYKNRTLKQLLNGNLRTKQRSEEHTSELQSPCNLVCRLLLEKKTHRTCTRPTVLESNAVADLYLQASTLARLAVRLAGDVSGPLIRTRGPRSGLDHGVVRQHH